MKELIFKPTFLFLLLFPLIIFSQNQCQKTIVSACIDLNSELHIKKGKLTWVYTPFAAPGSDPNCSGKTTVNNKVWSDCNTPYSLGFNTYEHTVEITALETNEISKIKQLPSEKNDWETIWEFGDPETPGAHRYSISLLFCPIKIKKQLTQKPKKNDGNNNHVAKECKSSSYLILFDAKKSILSDISKSKLDSISLISHMTNCIITIANNLEKSNNAASLKLYEERAMLVLNYLIEKHVGQDRIKYIAVGKSNDLSSASKNTLKIEIGENN